ncbi:MAG: dTDP-4-dehydrorhamnose 3,5-epimerase, partial [uncultured Pseudonocardia sp.]
ADPPDPAGRGRPDRSQAPGGRPRLLRPRVLPAGVPRRGPRPGRRADQHLVQPPGRHPARDALPVLPAPGDQADPLPARRDLRRDRGPAARLPHLHAALRRGAERGQHDLAARAEGLRARLPRAHRRRHRALPGVLRLHPGRRGRPPPRRPGAGHRVADAADGRVGEGRVLAPAVRGAAVRAARGREV